MSENPSDDDKEESGHYRVVVRPKKEFATFRIRDVGKDGHSQQLTGKMSGGGWKTHAWFISKKDAHIKHGKLLANEIQTKRILAKLSTPVRIRGNLFQATEKTR